MKAARRKLARQRGNNLQPTVQRMTFAESRRALKAHLWGRKSQEELDRENADAWDKQHPSNLSADVLILPEIEQTGGILVTASNRIKNNSHISDLAVGKDTSSMKMSLGKAMNKKFLNKLMEHKAEKEM